MTPRGGSFKCPICPICSHFSNKLKYYPHLGPQTLIFGAKIHGISMSPALTQTLPSQSDYWWHSPWRSIPKGEWPFSHHQIDFIGPLCQCADTNYFVLTMTDTYTGLLLAYPFQGANLTTIALIRTWFPLGPQISWTLIRIHTLVLIQFRHRPYKKATLATFICPIIYR